MSDIQHTAESLIGEALSNPGTLSACYSQFHNYSSLNRLLAWMQLGQPEPINTYKGWQALGRQVKKGAKAIALKMPVVVKDKETGDVEKVIFIERKNWFGVSDTEGQDYVMPEIPEFSLDNALKGLGITQEVFRQVDGNCQGYAYASRQVIAINPIAENPLKTALHEIAHCLLHSEEGLMNDSETLETSVKEVEAELTSYIARNMLGFTEGNEKSRGYIQHWLKQANQEKVRFGKVLGAVDKILKAGSKVEGTSC